MATGSFDATWDVNHHQLPGEDPLRWQRRRSFLTAHQMRMPEPELTMLAHLFTNIEFLCCQQPAELLRNIVLPPVPAQAPQKPPPIPKKLTKKLRKSLRFQQMQREQRARTEQNAQNKAEQHRLRQLAPLQIRPKEADAAKKAHDIVANIAQKRSLATPAFADYPAKPKPEAIAKNEPDLRLLLNRSAGSLSSASSGCQTPQRQIPPPPPLVGRRSHSPITFDLGDKTPPKETQSPVAACPKREGNAETAEPEAKRPKPNLPQCEDEALDISPERGRLSVRTDLVECDPEAVYLQDQQIQPDDDALRVSIENHPNDDPNSPDDVIYVNTFPGDAAEPEQKQLDHADPQQPLHQSFFAQTPESVQHFRSLILLDYSQPDTADRSYTILRQTADRNQIPMMFAFKKPQDTYVCKVNVGEFAAISTVPTTNRDEARATACDSLLRQLQRLFYTIQSKPHDDVVADAAAAADCPLIIDAGFIERTMNGDRLSTNNRGFRMLCQLGWNGGGLGSPGSPGGIEEPIVVRQNGGRRGLGAGSSGQQTIEQMTPKLTNMFVGLLLDFVADDSNIGQIRVELEMSERGWKQLTQLVERVGLKQTRFVTTVGQDLQAQMLIEKRISPADMADNIAWGGAYAARFNLWPPLSDDE